MDQSGVVRVSHSSQSQSDTPTFGIVPFVLLKCHVMLRFRPPRSHLKTLIVGRAALPPWAGAPDLPPESSSLLVWSQHPKNAKNAQRGREQARDNLASDRGSRPFCGAMLLAHGQGRKSFAMRIYETRTGVNFFFY